MANVVDISSARRDRRTLPYNLDAEASILGGLIVKPESLADLVELEIDDFYDHKHRVVFTAMRNLQAADRPIDVVTLENEIDKAEKLDAIGGIGFLGELALRVPTTDNVLAYRDIVTLHARNRRAILQLSSALERAYTWPHDPADLIIEVAGELGRLEHDGKQIAERKKARWSVELSNFIGDSEPDDDDSEDWIIRDLIPRGEPILWGGPPKGGKTWGALDLCISVALGEKWLGKFDNTMGRPARVLGLFLEDNTRRLRRRLWELCRARNISPNDPTLRENLRVSRTPLRLPDAADQRRLIAEIQDWGASLVIIDNLTRVMVGDPNSTKDASAFTRAWAEIGDATGASVGFLHHTRKPPGDPKSTVDPFDLIRGSGDFTATARNIIVTTPIRTDSEQKLSEIRMRGNLDLRCESFVLGFERTSLLGKWRSKLVDKGEVDEVKENAATQRKASKETKKREALAAEIQKRRDRALEIVRKEGSVSQARLGLELGLSPRSLATIFTALVDSGVLVTAGRRGYELPVEPVAQKDLLP